MLAACSGGGGGYSAGSASIQLVGWPSTTGTYTFATTDPPGQTFATGPISSTGTFSYTLATPTTLKPAFSPPPTGCTVSAPDAQGANSQVVEFTTTGGDKYTLDITSLAPGATKGAVGDGEVVALIYVNKDVTVSGTCGGSTPGSPTYNASLKTGWNWVWLEITAVDASSTPTATAYKAGTSLPSSFKWYVSTSAPAITSSGQGKPQLFR
jgi:hypothetical protein